MLEWGKAGYCFCRAVSVEFYWNAAVLVYLLSMGALCRDQDAHKPKYLLSHCLRNSWPTGTLV